jgi:hypothetical protein
MFAATRAAMHAVAEWVLAPARYAEERRIGLRATPGGFGTPPLPDGRILRVEDAGLVVERGSALAITKLETLAQAAVDAGVEPGRHTGVYDAATDWEPDRPLPIEDESAAFLAAWFAFTDAVLGELRAEAREPSEIQLWPEHFDLAMDVAEGRSRVNVGGSPGDAEHPLPYLYVGPWELDRDDPFWNEPFGSSLPYDELLAAGDQRATALAFLRAGLDHS